MERTERLAVHVDEALRLADRADVGSSGADVKVQRAMVSKTFGNANLYFFDSTTHPLDDPSLALP